MKLSTYKKILLAGAILGITASPAQADLFAISKLTIEEFEILGSDGELLDADVDFNTLNFTSSADMDGALTGTGGFIFDEPNGDDIDFTVSCLSTTGDCNPLTENNFEFYTGPQGADYVAADQLQEGSPILNAERLDGTIFPTPANVGQEAIGSLSATEAEGTANVNNGLEANWTFTLAQDQGITFQGDITTYLEAFTSADEIFPGKASAATEFQITITDLETGNVVFNSNDEVGIDLFNQTTSANAGLGLIQTCGTLATVLGDCGIELNTAFAFTTVELLADNRYQLSVRSNANIDIARVAQVPEPSMLALLGAGLLGMAMSRRRKS